METGNSEKLSIVTKLGFGAGDIYGGGAFMLVGVYYMYFLTDVVQIPPALVGILILVSKVWDAVNDPLMGIITDRTRSRFGRRRPFLLAGVVFIFISFVLLWYPVRFDSPYARFAFMLGAYIFFDTVITMVMVPYNALASELTLSYRERTSLTAVRMGFSMFSSILCAVVPMEIIKGIPDVYTGHIVMSTTFGLLFALPFIATFLTTRERKEFQKEQPEFSILESYREPFRIRTFIRAILMYLFSFLSMDVVMTVVIYYMTYYLGRGAETNYVLGALLVAQFVSIPVFYAIAGRTSKKTGFIVSLVAWIALMVLSFFITPGLHRAAVYVFAALVGWCTGGIIVMIYSIFPDLPDVDELRTGMRREGVYAGLITFSRKLSAALALFLISQTIALVGYIRPRQETVEGATRLVQQAQSPEFVLAIRIIFAAVPVALLFLCLWAASGYPLSPGLHERLKSYLAARRAGARGDDLDREERELKEVLM
jgi:oligogalacturonide transporter